MTAGKYRSMPFEPTSKSWPTDGLTPVATSTSRRHEREELSPAGMQASLPDSQRLPLCHTAERKRSEEHTSELQSRGQLVCRLLLEKKTSSGSRNRRAFSRLASRQKTWTTSR